MQAKYSGFRLYGAPNYPTGSVLRHISNGSAKKGDFFKAAIRGSERVIPTIFDDNCGLFKGILITNTQMKDIPIYDEKTNSTKLVELDRPHIKLNFFVFSPATNSGLYLQYKDSVPPSEFANVINEVYKPLNDGAYKQAVLKAATKKAANELKSGHYPSGRRRLKYSPILSEESFDEILHGSSGALDVDIDVDAEKLIPGVTSRRRLSNTIKTTRLSFQFHKEHLGNTIAFIDAVVKALDAQGHRAKVVNAARERVIYNSDNKEYFFSQPYEEIKPFLSVKLTNFESCHIFDKMVEIASSHPIFQDGIGNGETDE